MIAPIIIILSVLLIALLIDWEALGKKVPAIGRLVRLWTDRQRGVRRPVVQSRAPQQAGERKAVAMPQGAPTPSMRPTADDSQFLSNAVVGKTAPEVAQPTANPEVQELLDKADVCFRKGELKAAEQYYLKAAEKDPRCAKAYSRLGVIYLETGEDWQDAEDAFRHALKLDSNNGYILNNLGLVLYHQDKYADAIRNFELAVRQDEHNANRHANLGKAYMAMRQYAKGESSFKKALKLAPNEMEYKDLLEEAIEKKQAHRAMIRR